MSRLILTVLAALYLCGCTHAKSKYVTVNLNAKWESTPLLLETSEFLAKESNAYFWSFVDKISNLSPSTFGEHDEAEYSIALKYSSQLLSPLQQRLLKFSLALRANSPAVEMFNQMSLDKKAPTECEGFVDVNNMITCEKAAFNAFMNVADNQAKPLLIKSDHHYPGPNKDTTITVILYAELGKPAFFEWHSELSALAKEGKIDYVLRHYIKESSGIKTRLSGYGVELAIKSQEYKAKDDTKVEQDGTTAEEALDEDEDIQGFNFGKLQHLHPDLKDNLAEYRQHLVDSTNEIAPMKAWEYQDLSLQAAQKIMAAPEQERLQLLRDISQNFPIVARSLVKVSVKDELKKEIKKNQQIFESNFGLAAGESAMFINGQQVDLDIYDVFSLLDTMKEEAKLMEGLHTLGIKGNDLDSLLKLDLREDDVNYAVDIRDPSVIYLNNLEKDKRYSNWPSSLQELLRPSYPGMLRHMRKNLFSLVFIVNPADKSSHDLLKLAEAFYVHKAPVCIGLLLVPGNDDTDTSAFVAMWRAFQYIKKEDSAFRALSFITDVYEAAGEDSVTEAVIISTFQSVRAGIPNDIVFTESNDVGMKEAEAFLKKIGLGESPQVLVNGVPLKESELNSDSFEEAVVSQILSLTTDIQRAVYNGFLYDGMNVQDYVMTRSNVMPRLNARVLSTAEQFLNFAADLPSGVLEKPELFSQLTASQMTSAIASSLKYLHKKDANNVKSITNWIVTDLETVEGRKLLYDAFKQLKSTSAIRIGVIHNPSEVSTAADAHFLPRVIEATLSSIPTSMAKAFITKLLKPEHLAALEAGEKTLDDLAVNNMDISALHDAMESQTPVFLSSHQMFCRQVLGFSPGERGVITNGKVLGPFRRDEVFMTEDFSLLEKYMSQTSGDNIKAKVSKLGKDDAEGSDLVLKVSSLLLAYPQKEGRKQVDYHQSKHSCIVLPANDPAAPAYDIIAILDPASRAAQKYTPIIMTLYKALNVNVKVFLNSRTKLSEMPLKSFYRFVLEPEVTFSVDSSLATGPAAHFTDLPQKPILTLGMEPPESWLVEAVWAPYDLDNIHLAEVESGVRGDFDLAHLLLEGHCFDSQTGQPPRGLQFTLGTSTRPAIVDTIVMANLGYFQLKASPGAWNLKLRPGRSLDIYDISNHDYADSVVGTSGNHDSIVVINAFTSKIIKVRVTKKAGQEKEDLLGGSEEAAGGIWNSISRSLTGSGESEKPAEEKDETLNIFSLASGHLYERFLRIMMLSVLKNTKSKVKFWFLKNYLSPVFKDFIPHMAEEYEFEYELVEYKWPRWLHQQTEKQRVIWGYKILFLDVLFPLSVNKFLFVDADQIVRTDLQELADLDLEGAPYGYTPFCDSRKEMDGFRFWKSGYWSQHLAGRKYHISALYVVDLRKFRKIAAGDRLRGQYQGLSQDPNSLSNLDQDLPNNMIHQVPIKSLPQEWLWCETWCADSGLKTAKTIDLCNNPLTKEPKLQAAQRIVPEWTDYDKEVKVLWDRITKGKSKTVGKDAPTEQTKKEEL